MGLLSAIKGTPMKKKENCLSKYAVHDIVQSSFKTLAPESILEVDDSTSISMHIKVTNSNRKYGN